MVERSSTFLIQSECLGSVKSSLSMGSFAENLKNMANDSFSKDSKFLDSISSRVIISKGYESGDTNPFQFFEESKNDKHKLKIIEGKKFELTIGAECYSFLGERMHSMAEAEEIFNILLKNYNEEKDPKYYYY